MMIRLVTINFEQTRTRTRVCTRAQRCKCDQNLVAKIIIDHDVYVELYIDSYK